MTRLSASDRQQQAIFSPFFATILLTIVVWVYMYIRRIHFFKTTKYPLDKIQRAEDLARVTPPAVANPSDNLKNLFEVPVLFYATVLYLFVTKQVDTSYVIAAWLYFFFRVLHSAIHCTINIIIVRFYIYVASCLALYYMIFRAVFVHFTS